MGKAGRIPSLDGWRAISIVLVLMGHEIVDGTFLLRVHLSHQTMNFFVWHSYGVEMFFVISGFIITHLLLREERAAGTINLRSFYLRRFYRIVPPLVAYVFILFLLSLFFHSETIRPVVWVAAVLFLANVTSLGTSWSTGHLWSLAVEEQYYLFWPFVFLRRKLRYIVPWIFICVAPVFRMIDYKRPETFGQFSFFVRSDAIFAGALFALYQDALPGRQWLRRIEYGVLLLTAACLSCQKLLVPYTGFLTIPFNYTLFAASVVILIRWSLMPESVLYKLLNARPMVWTGKLSYSLYLWQQLFYPPSILGLRAGTLFPYNFFFMFVLAAASYYFIERPVRNWRQKVIPGTNRVTGESAPRASELSSLLSTTSREKT